MLEILLCFTIAGFLFLLAYLVHRMLNNSHKNEDTVTISASSLHREIEAISSAFQNKYYLRRINITGTVTEIEILNTSKNKNNCRQRVMLDKVICCEFVQVQKNIRKGEKAEFSGLCLGKILTDCTVI